MPECGTGRVDSRPPATVLALPAVLPGVDPNGKMLLPCVPRDDGWFEKPLGRRVGIAAERGSPALAHAANPDVRDVPVSQNYDRASTINKDTTTRDEGLKRR